MDTFEDAIREAVLIMEVMPYFRPLTGRLSGYRSNPSRSQSSPWAASDMWKAWHPFDALLAERRDGLKSERQAIEAQAKKDAAWWDERRRG